MVNWKGAAKTGAAGWSAGSTLGGPAGGAMWGLGGFWGGLEAPDDWMGAPSLGGTGQGTGAYQPSSGSFYAPSGGDYFGQGGGGDWWLGQAYTPRPSTKDIEAARMAALASRGTVEEGLGYLGQYARGEKSASREAMREALSRAEARYGAQGRAARSPAEARAFAYQQAGAQQQAASAGAQAAMKEQLGAQQAYLSAAGAQRQADISMLGQETQSRLAEIQGDVALQNIKAKFLQLGLTDREADRRARIELEKLRFMAYEGAAGRQQQRELTEYEKEQDFWRGLMGGMIGAGGEAMGAWALSDEACKTGVGNPGSFLDDPLMEAPVYDPNYGIDVYERMEQARAAETQAEEEARKAAEAQRLKEQKASKMAGIFEKLGGGIAGDQESGREPLGKRLADAAVEQNAASVRQLFGEIGGLQEVGFPEEEPVSDINEKNIVDFMDKMNPVQFEFKNQERNGYGSRTGVIAQEVEESRLGDGMVVEDEMGTKHLDVSPGKFNPLVLASLANLNKRMKKLEGR